MRRDGVRTGMRHFVSPKRSRNLLRGDLQPVDRPALGEFLGARERNGHGLEAGVAHELRGDLERFGVIARNRDGHRLARAVRLFGEAHVAHRVEGAHHAGAL